MKYRFLWAVAALGVVPIMAAAVPAHADQPMIIDLTYDSEMDMVRPEFRPSIHVHHNLHVTISAEGGLNEKRDRNTDRDADRNSMRRVLESSGDGSGYASWQDEPNGTLVRIQNDPQSVRTMTLTLLPAIGAASMSRTG